MIVKATLFQSSLMQSCPDESVLMHQRQTLKWTHLAPTQVLKVCKIISVPS